MTAPCDVLLALHYQNDVIHPDGLIRVGIDNDQRREAVIDAAKRLLDHARTRGWKIVHVRVAFREDYADLPRNMPIMASVEEIGAVREGSWGAEFHEALAPRRCADEFVLKHTSISAFRGTPLAGLLQQFKAQRVHVAGVATHSVVESTVRDAADSGLDVTVVADACTAAQPDTHEAAIKSMALMARIATVAALKEATS